jgi:hypothetical protein
MDNDDASDNDDDDDNHEVTSICTPSKFLKIGLRLVGFKRRQV